MYIPRGAVRSVLRLLLCYFFCVFAAELTGFQIPRCCCRYALSFLLMRVPVNMRTLIHMSCRSISSLRATTSPLCGKAPFEGKGAALMHQEAVAASGGGSAPPAEKLYKDLQAVWKLRLQVRFARWRSRSFVAWRCAAF